MQETVIDIEDRRGQALVPPPAPPGPASLEFTPALAVAQQCAMVSNLALSNQVANTDLAAKAQLAGQLGVDQLGLAILAHAVGRLQAPGAAQARAAVAALSGNEAASSLLGLRAATRMAARAKRPAR